MKRVYQTRCNGTNGNCFAACVASMLDLELDQAPDISAADDNPDWWQQWVEWWTANGINFLFWQAASCKGVYLSPGTLVMVGGLSPRAVKDGLDYLHCIVAEYKVLESGVPYYAYVHDPMPLSRTPDVKHWLVGDPIDFLVLYRKQPAKNLVLKSTSITSEEAVR